MKFNLFKSSENVHFDASIALNVFLFRFTMNECVRFQCIRRFYDTAYCTEACRAEYYRICIDLFLLYELALWI